MTKGRKPSACLLIKMPSLMLFDRLNPNTIYEKGTKKEQDKSRIYLLCQLDQVKEMGNLGDEKTDGDRDPGRDGRGEQRPFSTPGLFANC